MTPSFCSQCGTALPSDAKFCPHCAHPVASSYAGSAPEWEGQVVDLLKQGKAITAIKLYREKTGLGLKEAKDAVEALACREQIPLKNSGAQGAGCSGCILLIVCLFLGLMTATAGTALFPSLGQIVSPLICEKGLKIQSDAYSYKPGQRGVTRTFYCEDRPGERRIVNGRVLLLSFLAYTFVYGILLGLYQGFQKTFRKNSVN
jgi:hypothetical protein